MKYFKWLFCLWALSSCEEVISPSLIFSEEVPVIDASISTDLANCYVKLSKTAPYNSPGATKPLVGQQVEVRNRAGQVFPFREVSAGLYKPVEGFSGGQAGDFYFFKTTIEGKEYTANASLLPVPTIDSATYIYSENNPTRADGYYVSYYHQDPPEKNFYRWKVYKNGESIDGKTANIRNDANVNGKYLALSLPNTFQKGDTVDIELYGITNKGFLYLQSMNGLLTTNAPSQAVPENPNSNLAGNSTVLGFFMTSSISSVRVIIEK